MNDEVVASAASRINPYLPALATVEQITQETWDTRTFRVALVDPAEREAFSYLPGQFLEVSAFGIGESPFGFSSTPSRPGFLEFSVKRLGQVTSALHELEQGTTIGVRGPLGNSFPCQQIRGKRLVFVGGGIGMAPLRSLINYCLDHRADYGPALIIYGARTPGDLCYRQDLEDWAKAPEAELKLTVDRGDDGWTGHVGFVPAYLAELAPSPEGAVAITCGPPIMIKFVLQELTKLGFTPEQIVTTLEMKMKCGIGKCGRCNVGDKYVCLDGPVFTYAQLRQMPAEY